MSNQAIKILILMILFSSAIFCADILITGGAFSSFYVCIVLLSLLSDDDRLLLGATAGSIILVFASYAYSLTDFEWPTLTNKLVSFAMIAITSLLSIRTREKSQRLHRLNETLEFRVLARTAASEAKSKRLEKQIEVLQIIRKHDTDNAMSGLDQVINDLKTLAMEKTDSNFEELK